MTSGIHLPGVHKHTTTREGLVESHHHCTGRLLHVADGKQNATGAGASIGGIDSNLSISKESKVISSIIVGLTHTEQIVLHFIWPLGRGKRQGKSSERDCSAERLPG